MIANIYSYGCTRINLLFTLVFILGMPLLSQAQSYKIMPLGNSITEGNDRYGSYRYDLYAKLTEAYIRFNYVGSQTSVSSSEHISPLGTCPKDPIEIPPLAHEGHWGWRADELINGKAGAASEGKLADWLQGYTPDVVLMHVGTNDILQNQSVSSTITELQEIVRILRQDNPRVTILLAKLFPAYAPTVGTTAANNINLLNNEIPALVQELNTSTSPVLLVDQNTGFNPAPDRDTYDGIHPNYSGEYHMARNWFDVLRGVLSSYTTPPAVEITTPDYNSIHKVNQAVTIKASAWDREEAITRVEFYADCQKIGEDNTSPYQISWTPSETGNYAITAAATDAAGAQGEAYNVYITVDETETGTITREYWANVPGSSVSGIPLTTSPTSVTEISAFEAPTNVAYDYGQRIRGYIKAPLHGEYTFWIAADDNAELWLSASDRPADKVKLAFVEGWTNPQEWEKYAGQKSVKVYLEGGKRYYIEALHKQGRGGDNLAVGWQLPNGTYERPVPGFRLLPFTPTTSNQAPRADAGQDQSITLPTNTITLHGRGTDSDGTISSYSWSQVKGPGSTVFSSQSAATTAITGLVQGTYIFQLMVTDNGGLRGTDEVSVTVHPAPVSACTASGTILREHWSNVSGSSVSDIPLSSAPVSTSQLYLFEAPSGLGSNYGARIRGYICPPQTGTYTFFIASDDNSELWLSTTDSPANKVKIASVTGFTSSRQWDKYASQKSVGVRLEAGKKYYIEALHKQGWGGDNLAVAWALPDGKMEAPVPGSRLSPFEHSDNITCTASGTILREHWGGVSGSSVTDIPLSSAPSSTSQLNLFEAPSGLGSNYGARVRGYICPPQTGDYTFFIASDDNSELFLSTTDSPANKVKIASVTGWTSARQWDKYPSQKSVPVRLEAGKRYYIEALHKQGWGGDNLAVAWTMPDGKMEAPIAGNRLSPAIQSQSTTSRLVSGNEQKVGGPLVVHYPNPFMQQVTLQLNGKKEEKYSLKLYDVTGRVVWHVENVEADRKLIIGQELETGVYVLLVSAGKEAKQYKLVKTK